MFRLDDEFTEEDLSEVKDGLDKNYLLKPSDRLQLNVFTNNGERLIDPNFEISTLSGGGGQGMAQQQQQRDRFILRPFCYPFLRSPNPLRRFLG